MNEPLSWSIEQSAEHVTLHLRGAVTEDSDLTELLQQVRWDRAVRLDLAGITRINSCGIREWLQMMSAVPDEASRVELLRCPPVLVNQLNSISNFSGSAVVSSVGLPFHCPACDQTQTFYVGIEDCNSPKLDGRRCNHCGEQLEFDDLPQTYFAFMSYVRRP